MINGLFPGGSVVVPDSETKNLAVVDIAENYYKVPASEMTLRACLNWP
jgi:hypothetical protein